MPLHAPSPADAARRWSTTGGGDRHRGVLNASRVTSDGTELRLQQFHHLLAGGGERIAIS